MLDTFARLNAPPSSTRGKKTLLCADHVAAAASTPPPVATMLDSEVEGSTLMAWPAFHVKYDISTTLGGPSNTARPAHMFVGPPTDQRAHNQAVAIRTRPGGGPRAELCPHVSRLGRK